MADFIRELRAVEGLYGDFWARSCSTENKGRKNRGLREKCFC